MKNKGDFEMKRTSNILYKIKPTQIRLSDTKTSSTGPAGIKSLQRPAEKTSAARYSTVGLILDKIFIENSIIAYESDEAIYTKFTHGGVTYEACYDGGSITWIGSVPNDYMVLVPMVVFSLSEGNSRSDCSDELKCYFRNIKEGSNLKEVVLLFCDAFYYGFIQAEGRNDFDCIPNGLRAEVIREAISAGVFHQMSLFSDISPKLDFEASATPVVSEKTETDYAVKYDFWEEEEKARIPNKKMLDTYVKTESTESIARKIKYRLDRVIDRINSGAEGVEAIGNDYINILLVGRPATGKTTTANAVGAMTKLPVYEIPFSKNTEEDTIEGKNKVVNGQIDFVETEFLKAYEHGGIIVCEEINLADPAVVMGALGQAIEYPFVVMKDGYKPVRRHPLCVIIGTMNTGTAGSKQLNQALSSRFKCTYILDDPDKKTFIDILASKGHEMDKCRYVYDAYTSIINYLKDPKQSQEELCENITLRGCFGALECMQEGDDPKTALNNTLVGKIAEVDLEAAKSVKDNVIDSLREFGGTRRRRR